MHMCVHTRLNCGRCGNNLLRGLTLVLGLLLFVSATILAVRARRVRVRACARACVRVRACVRAYVFAHRLQLGASATRRSLRPLRPAAPND